MLERALAPADAADAAAPPSKAALREACRDALAYGVGEGVQTDEVIATAMRGIFGASIVVQLKDKVRVGAAAALVAAAKERGVKPSRSHAAILGALERLLSVDHPELAPKTSVVLHKLYDADVLEEAAVRAWYATEFAGNAATHPERKAAHVAVRKGASAFVKWLEEAEEESD
mmetsp:Transcript_23506/g.60452  ORF Transcript_23506/g.60452 Transcript_23506/m.60452 type:complete len:173 (-) Transcript_23506:208-726(-)